MRNFTKIVLSLAMAFGIVGGVNSVSATKTNWSPSTWVATWTSGTKTMSWNGSDGSKVMNTGLELGDLASKYTKIRVDITSITGDNDNIQMKVASTDKSDKFINLSVGVNNIIFTDYSSEINFSDVTEISLWGTGSSDGTAVITDCYLYNPVKPIEKATGFGTEITQLSDITDGTRFVIGDGTNAMYFITGENARNSLSTAVTNVPSDSYYCYTLTNAGLDLNGDSEIDDDLFIVSIVNKNGDAFPNQYGWSNKLNISQYGGGIFSGNLNTTQYGQDYQYGAVWRVAYVGGNGFTFKNVSSEMGNYMKVASSQAETYYLKLYQSINFASSTDLEKENNAANDAIFALADADGYDAETGVMTNGTWTFGTPVDLTDWDYLMITTANTAADASHEITIKDEDGVTVKGEDYSGSTAGTGKNMWLDRWNNQNAIRISMDYLRKVKSMDISKIKSLKINGTVKVANVYLTDYNNTKINGGYAVGDLERSYSATGKFGTICLDYKASCAGAEVYEIVNKTGSTVTLDRVTGLLQPGVPYFYKSSDTVGKDNAGSVRNVQFFQADLDTYNAASAGTNNGLVGTFSEITAPVGANYYILSSNMLYNTVGCTGENAVTIGANKAYVDISAISPSLARGVIDLFFDETTGVAEVKAQSENARCEFYNLAGQRVAQPTKGMYIVNGKKVILK